MNKKIFFGYLVFSLVLTLFGISLASADEANICCEKTTSGLSCQNVPASECAADSRQAPSSCNTVSFCKPGFCYDSQEGLCSENTPQVTCNANGGVWSATQPPQCSLGCCVLGDQAAFVSLTRCKKLSSELGLTTKYDSSITNEVQCVLSALGQEKGACVYEFEFENTCKMTTRADCSIGVNSSGTKGQFYAGKLCSAEELATNCGPTERTTCVPGKDGVYFVDSCGNPANIYDASKIRDKEYWSNIYDVSESCNPNSNNALSGGCGNCNYLLGSFCRDASKLDKEPQYGDYMCSDLNCKNTVNGNDYKHGESWCVSSDKTELDQGDNSVGSRYYRHLCINGEEVVEQCADYRQEECISQIIETEEVDFSQAACRVNRWRDCTAQTNQQSCENSDKRDCLWKPGLSLNGNETAKGSCVPKNSPGLQFWEGQDAQDVCNQASAQCVVVFEKGLIGGEKCKKGCECLTEDWNRQRAALCSALGDCGPKTNWIGDSGASSGYNVTRERI